MKDNKKIPPIHFLQSFYVTGPAFLIFILDKCYWPMKLPMQDIMERYEPGGVQKKIILWIRLTLILYW